MVFTSVSIKYATKYNIYWLDNKFIPIEQLFPHWKCAEFIIKDFIDKTNNWEVVVQDRNINVSLKFPSVFDEIKGKEISMIDSFPPEDRKEVINLCLKLMRDYLPDFKDIIGERKDNHIIDLIKSRIEEKKHYITSVGGRQWRDELYFRFGICCLKERN